MAEIATVAQRIQIYRRRRGLSQVRLAIAIGRSESWLSQVERGERSVDRLSVLLKMADVLNVPVTELTGDPPAITNPHSAEHVLIVAIRTLLSGHDFLMHLFSLRVPEAPTAADEGHAGDDRLRELWTLTHASDYAELGALLPAFITEAETAARTCADGDRPAAFRRVAGAYQVGAAVVAKLGQNDMAWVMADRSIIAAERSDDPLLAIAGDFRLGHAFLSGGKPSQALRAAESGAAAAAVRVGQGDVSALCLVGR